MSRRIVGALTGAALLTGILALQVASPRTVEAANCSAPAVSSVTNSLGHTNDLVTVSGSGFTCGGQSNGTSLTVGGSNQHITGLSDNQVQFQASGAAGSVVVTVSHPVLLGSQTMSSNTDRLFLIAPVAANNTARPSPGGSFTVSGSGFTMGGYLQGITANACGNLAVGGISDTSVALTAPNSYCNGAVSLGITGYATTAKSGGPNTNTIGIGGGGVDITPGLGGLSPSAQEPGKTVSFAGTGLGNSGSATLNGAGIGSVWNDSSITITVLPTSTSGEVKFVRSDGYTISAGTLTVNSVVSGLSASHAQPGDTVTLNGAGFGPSAGTVTVGGTALPIKGWSPTSIAVSIPADASTGDLTVTPQGNAAFTVPNGLTVIHLVALKPADGAPGATVGITGSGFGSQKGTVTIAGVSAPVTIWGDSTIAVTVPTIARFAHSGGDDHIVVTVPGAASPLTAAFHVDPGPPAPPAPTPGQTPGSTPGSTSNPTGTASPTNAPTFIPPGANGPIIQIGPVPFSRPPQVAGPVNLQLAAASVADPGVNVPFTVTLTAFGQPVVGAPVDLLLVVVPGGDASVTPAKGVTDASGKVSGVLHLSKRAGDHIILARSGQYSDEVKVTGRGLADTGGGSSSPGGSSSGLGSLGGGSPQRTIIVAALLACLVLFLSGFGINIATARGSAAVGVATIGHKRTLAGSIVAVPVNAGAAAQFGMAMIVCGFGQLVAMARGR